MICSIACGQSIQRNNFTTNTGPQFNGFGLTNLTASGTFSGANLMPSTGVYTNNALAGFPTFGVHLTAGVVYNYYTDPNCVGVASGDGMATYPDSSPGQNAWSGYFTVPTNGNYIFADFSGSAGDIFSSQLYISNNLIIPTDFTVEGNATVVGNFTAPGIPSTSQSNNWKASQAYQLPNYHYNALQYQFSGTITATLNSQTFIAAAGSFTSNSPYGPLVFGSIINLTNGDGSTSQYRILKVRNSSTLIVDTGATVAYTANPSCLIFPPTSFYYDFNNNLQMTVGQDGSVINSGLAQDGTSNSGVIGNVNGTNSVWWSSLFDSVNNWYTLHTFKLGSTTFGPFTVHPQAPANCIQVQSNGNVLVTFGVVNGNVTNTVTGTLIQTNFISGKLYTNIYGRPILATANATLATTGVSGNASLSLLASGYLTNVFGMSTIVTSIAMSYTNVISMVVPASQTYTFTNTSAGAGDSSAVLGGQILVY